ncbi:MmcQ/YjbR family DNA-binding protein [Phycisphaeraceae bacterium D3-23]
MPTKPKDPTEPIRLKASQYPGVDEGTACTQSSFKANKKAFLFIGEQGGRYKAMFKLDKSMPEARKLAEKHPEDYQAGNIGWVTARFSADKPMPKTRWGKWLDESYALSAGPKKQAGNSEPAKASKKKAVKKEAAKKKTAGKKAKKT